MGLVHLYYGDGKGKSTAAAGLALRALGSGFCVILVRLCKGGEPESGEVKLLEKNGARVINGKPESGFASRLDADGKERLRLFQNGILKELIESLSKSGPKEQGKMLVLDEALAACEMELVDEELVKEIVREGRKQAEIVLTGRNPCDWMLEEADYITQLRAERHPYEKGITARKGIEY